MGAHPEDYARQAPERSYIHVDDFESPKDLADFLHLLDQNDDLYNEYFRWKGTGEFINTYFMCRLCSMLHDEGHQQHYEDINIWWRGSGTCINGSWRKYDKMKSEGEKKKLPNPEG
ncbi:Alpha-(1,3)-fucosyltransferase 7 [Halocaridina rubra]|uniref:Fucosyltransferase n=1 Tax=Halocaridina rubra TaxID=373956 RepID=A0AAN8ZZ06_HALRR